jgi:ABC-type multidrug transport system ATPase subunit
MPQDALPSPHATLRQSLRYYGELQGLERARAWREADRWLEQVRLAERADARQSQLSHGMRRRFSVAQALLGEPELILLDEPTAGVDPELAAELRALFRAQSGRATLLISSHVLSELEELCDHAIVIEKGRAVRQGSMQSLLQADTLVRVTLSAAADLTRLAAQLPGARFEWQPPELRVRWSDAAPLEQLNARLLGALLEQGVGILALAAGQSLEASYLAERRAALGQGDSSVRAGGPARARPPSRQPGLAQTSGYQQATSCRPPGAVASSGGASRWQGSGSARGQRG